MKVSPWAAPVTPSYCQHCLARDSEASPPVLQGGGDPCSGLCKIWVPTHPGAPEEMLDCSSQPAPSSAAPDGLAVLARDPTPQGSSLCSWSCRKTLTSLLLSQSLFGHLSSTACLRTAWCSYRIHRWCHM